MSTTNSILDRMTQIADDCQVSIGTPRVEPFDSGKLSQQQITVVIPVHADGTVTDYLNDLLYTSLIEDGWGNAYDVDIMAFFDCADDDDSSFDGFGG